MLNVIYKYTLQKKKNTQEKSVTWRHLLVVLGRGAEEISVPPIPDTFLDTIVDGDADNSHENNETNNYARHATSTKNRSSTQ